MRGAPRGRGVPTAAPWRPGLARRHQPPAALMALRSDCDAHGLADADFLAADGQLVARPDADESSRTYRSPNAAIVAGSDLGWCAPTCRPPAAVRSPSPCGRGAWIPLRPGARAMARTREALWLGGGRLASGAGQSAGVYGARHAHLDARGPSVAGRTGALRAARPTPRLLRPRPEAPGTWCGSPHTSPASSGSAAADRSPEAGRGCRRKPGGTCPAATRGAARGVDASTRDRASSSGGSRRRDAIRPPDPRGWLGDDALQSIAPRG